MTRVLAFTCSRYRPVFLRHCILQMQNQTYQVDHAVYVNAENGDSSSNYLPILEEFKPIDERHLFLSFGPSLKQHDNHVTAINLAPWESYDLFLKVDDDDVYLKDYVEKVVTDFEKNHWDFSGSSAENQINGRHYIPHALNHLGYTPFDETLSIPGKMFLGGTLAFSLKAMQFLMTLRATPGLWEDLMWIRSIAGNAALKTCRRENSRYIYNIHGQNLTTSKCLKKD